MESIRYNGVDIDKRIQKAINEDRCLHDLYSLMQKIFSTTMPKMTVSDKGEVTVIWGDTRISEIQKQIQSRVNFIIGYYRR